MNLNMLNPFVRFSRLFSENPMSIPTVRICYDCRIFFFSNITGTVTVNNDKYNISDKTAIYFPPETEYRFDIDFDKNSSVIILNFDLVNDFSYITKPISPALRDNFTEANALKYELFPGLSKPIVKTLPKIEGMLNRCTDNFILKNEFYIENTSALVKLCLIEFLKQESGNDNSEICKKVLKYIRGNYLNPSLTNEEIASAFGYHPYYLSSLIKKETGRTLHQLLIYYRLRVAKDMLTTTDFDISEIAYRSGFETAAYFTKMFRKSSGCSPKEYRNTHLKNPF